jgi:transposase-like protein
VRWRGWGHKPPSRPDAVDAVKLIHEGRDELASGPQLSADVDTFCRPGLTEDPDLPRNQDFYLEDGNSQAMPRQKKYPDELLNRGVPMVFDSGHPVAHLACDLGIRHKSLRKWVRQAEARRWQAQGVAEQRGARGTGPFARRGVRAAPGQRDPQEHFGAFRRRARPTPLEVSAFVDERRGRFVVEPICSTLEVSASAYYERAKGARSDREIEDERLLGRIRIFDLSPSDCERGSGRLPSWG